MGPFFASTSLSPSSHWESNVHFDCWATIVVQGIIHVKKINNTFIRATSYSKHDLVVCNQVSKFLENFTFYMPKEWAGLCMFSNASEYHYWKIIVGFADGREEVQQMLLDRFLSHVLLSSSRHWWCKKKQEVYWKENAWLKFLTVGFRVLSVYLSKFKIQNLNWHCSNGF